MLTLGEDVVMWDSCAICHFLLGEVKMFKKGKNECIFPLSSIDTYDTENKLRPPGVAFTSDLHRLSFYTSGALT